MPPITPRQIIDKTVREEWGRILASLVKTLGDFQLAEDCLQDAIVSALDRWQQDGLPNSPAAWLITVARRKAIDRLRKSQNFAAKQNEISYLQDLDNQPFNESMVDMIPDRRLELIFTCCHPALEEKTRIALTLRTLGGLTTDEIAAAFLDKSDTMQQRLTRAKRKIAQAGIPYKIPDKTDMPDRLLSVLRVIYLIFNEGYWSRSGDALTRADLTDEAIRLARIMVHLMPEETEAAGLLALMLLHDSRRTTRTDNKGDMISLEHQNRGKWDGEKIKQGIELLTKTLPKQRIGPYQLQAAISAVHAQSPKWETTNWQEIAALYDMLYTIEPTSVVRINHAVAVSYASSLSEALGMLDAANTQGELNNYQPYFAARADFLARLGDIKEAKGCFSRAIELSENGQEAEFLRRKMDGL